MNPVLPLNRMAMRTTLTAMAVGLGMGLAAQNNIGINVNGAAPSPTAILDIDASALPANAKKGFLVPRMTTAQRPAGVDGMTIYQTDGVAGYYYYNATLGQWVRIPPGSAAWGLTGNDLVNPVNDYLGTTDATELNFRTNNIERMVVEAGGRVAMGAPTPLPAAQQLLEVSGAVRLTGTTAATNIGAIRWNATDLWHEGYMGPAVGWRKLPNDYLVFGPQAYQHQAEATCGTGTSEISNGIPNTPLPPACPACNTGQWNNGATVTPYINGVACRVMRKQMMFLVNELNVELAQLNGNTTWTEGLCPGQPINEIAFYIGQGGLVKQWTWQVAVFHAPPGVNDLTGGFVTNSDPAAGCGFNMALTNRPVAGAGAWDAFALSTPFTWDGVRNVIVEVTMYAMTVGGVGNNVPVKVSTAANLSYTRYSPLVTGTCGNVATACSGAIQGSAMDNTCGAGGVSALRPVVRFGGTVSSTPGPILSGNGNYVVYDGGFMVEDTPGWRLWVNPPDPYRSFKGPGSIHAQNGVYDNGVRLNDHVFDRHFDGRVAPEDAEAAGGLRNRTIGEMAEFTRLNRHLPTMKGRDAWERERGFSFGDLTNQLWTTTETHALYLTELNRQAHLLEVLSTDRPLRPEELAPMTSAVKQLPELTDAQKARLVNDLGERIVTEPRTTP